ncbi:hypothetical protein M5689_025236 [Euphorbia peplus]|nr:hypothetical protein M5689_025236 [Euphorbia peplus]
MNEVIRSMALQIMEENNERGMIKNHMSLKDLQDEEHWTEDLVSVSLVANKIKSIRLLFSPSCPKLSTPSLRRNLGLGDIRGICFRGMPGLKVLNLSATSIQSLPSSIDGLVNLTAMILSDCRKLIKFTEALNKLDLSLSAVKEVGEDIEMPGKLAYLDLFCTQVNLQPQILAQLSHLQFLWLPCEFEVNAMVLAHLSRLETLRCYFDDVVELDNYLGYLKRFKGREAPIQLEVRVGKQAMYEDIFADELIHVEDYNDVVHEDLSVVILNSCNINETDMLIYFQQIAIVKCREVRSLCKFSPIKGATELKHFSVR